MLHSNVISVRYSNTLLSGYIEQYRTSEQKSVTRKLLEEETSPLEEQNFKKNFGEEVCDVVGAGNVAHNDNGDSDGFSHPMKPSKNRRMCLV